MRILALRGENLASLADPFVIDLTAEPLYGAGLFAITGETGAGKSTLLDAVCLSLYGRFPRIAAEGGNETLPDVAGDLLAARDPRSILRRGAAIAHAEVDFIGVDGARYRARWQVARARGKAAGRLQKVARLLQRLADDGTVAATLADKITEVDDEVRRLTDLTFEQFRRTVLLAQGDFDAFLRSDDRDRADLLEKITGTEVYARLSARTFEMTRERRETVEALRLRRAEVGLLSEEERAERTGRRNEIVERRREIDLLLGRREAELARLNAYDEVVRRLSEAEGEVARAEAAHAAAERERDLFADVHHARRLAPLVRAVDDAMRAEDAVAEGLAAAERDLAEATGRFEAATPARRTAQQNVADLEARIRTLSPEWEKAAALDGLIGNAMAEVATAQELRAAALATRDLQAARIADLETRRGEIAVEFGRIATEEARRAVFATLLSRWEDVSDHLGERIALRRRFLDTMERRRDAARTVADLHTRRVAAEGEAARRTEIRSGLERRRAEATKILLALDEASVRARDTELRALATDLEAVRPHVETLRRAETEAAEADRILESAGAEITEATALRAGVVADLTRTRDRLTETAGAQRLADALASHEAEHLRSHLTEGAPCPVCGATEHPILADPAIAEAMSEIRRRQTDLERRARDLTGRLTALDGRLAAAEARRQAATTAAEVASARIASTKVAIDEATKRVGIAAERLALPFPPGADRLERLATVVTDARMTCERALVEAERLRTELDRVRGEFEALDLEDRAAESADRRDAEAMAAARIAEATAASEEASTGSRLDEIDTRLAPVLTALDLTRADLDRDGDSLLRRLSGEVAHLRALAEARSRFEAEERDLERTILGDHVALEHSERALAGAEATIAARTSALDRLRLDRSELLGGEPTATHRGTVEAARDAARAALDRATAALDAARSAQATALALRGERHDALARARAEAVERRHERDHALAAADLDLQTVKALLDKPEIEVEALAAGLTAIDRRLAEATAAVAARRADRDAALAAGLPTCERNELRSLIETDRDEIRALDENVGRIAGELAADDAARARAGGLEAEIAEAEREARIWIAVDEAIGSRDGAKFRTFAQGITLDRLTGLANRHLATLSPRYRLTRTEGLGLAIVDRDMGDEMRSTRSLSGGERFLASLALALALSGLEGRRSFVDTLFIDEGFGSLDAATLDVAIDALESLQSEGRKVGVISHVTALHDRIPVQIRVRRSGMGRSRVEIDGNAG